MFVIVLNGSTYQRLRDLFPDVEWRSHRDYLMAEVHPDLATEMAKVAREAGLSVGEEEASQVLSPKRHPPLC
jgi:hypothetical protein